MSVNLQNLHSFRLPARAQALIRLNDISQLSALETISRYLVLAGGTNTVFVTDYQGAIVVPDFYGMTVEQSADCFRLRVGASENWHHFVTDCVERGIDGLENLALIPGTVGAAPVQNIGAYGVEVGAFIESVEAIDLVLKCPLQLDHSACQFGYRDSTFKRQVNRYLITHVNFKIPKQWRPVLSYGPLQQLQQRKTINAKEIYRAVIDVRQAKLPMPEELPNAGSFFKNPEITQQELDVLQLSYPDVPYYPTDNGFKVAAGWLIDTLGLKGFTYKGVAVHKQQALVLVNTGEATGEHLLALCQFIRHRIYQVFHILLEPEVRLIGMLGLVELQHPEYIALE